MFSFFPGTVRPVGAQPSAPAQRLPARGASRFGRANQSECFFLEAYSVRLIPKPESMEDLTDTSPGAQRQAGQATFNAGKLLKRPIEILFRHSQH